MLSGLGNKILHFKGSALVFAVRIGQLILGFASSLLLARFFGAEVVGELAVVTSAISILSTALVLGFDTSIIRFVSEHKSLSPDSARYIYFKSLVFIVCLVGVFCAATMPFAEVLLRNVLRLDLGSVLSCLLPFVIAANVVMKLNNGLLRAMKKVTFFSGVIFSQTLMNVLGLSLAVFFFSYQEAPIWIAFTAIVLASLASLAGAWSNAGSKGTGEVRRTSLSSMVAISFPMFFTSASALVMKHLDVLIMGHYLEKADVGHYFIAVKLSSVIGIVLYSMNVVSATRFSELYYSGDSVQLARYARMTTQVMTLLAAPAILVMTFGGEWALSFFGEEYRTASTVLALLAVGQLINVCCGSVGYFLNMTGHQLVMNRLFLAAAGINVVLNLLFIPKYGTVGAALASLSGIAFWNIGAVFVIKRKFGFWMCFFPSPDTISSTQR